MHRFKKLKMLLTTTSLIMATQHMMAEPMSAEKVAANSILSSYCVLRLVSTLKTQKDAKDISTLQTYALGLALIAGKKGIRMQRFNEIKSEVMGNVGLSLTHQRDSACALSLKSAHEWSINLKK